jgi:peptidyl-dipeptidase Dcp
MTINTNPLLQTWETPFGLPPFGDIELEHFKPAFAEAFKVQRAEIDAIAENNEEPDFTNTIEVLEGAGRQLRQAAAVFFNLSGSHTNEGLQEIERDVAPQFARHQMETLLNARLFARINALFEAKDRLDLNPEQQRVLERYHTMFVRAGARLEGDDRQRMNEINQRLAVIGTQFSQNILHDESSYELLLEEERDLAGLPDFLIAAAGRNAADRGHAGKYAITLSRSSIEPFLQFSDMRELREQAFNAWISRGEGGGDSDNREIVTETLNLREQRAKLLGYDTYATYKLDDQMAKTPEAVRDLLLAVWQPARARALDECEKLQKMVSEEGGNFNVEAWDWRYYSEKVRKQDHDIDEAEIKPYLQLNRIIEAAFDTANRLFGLSFKELEGMPVYHQDVRVFEVSDKTGQHVGIFIGDYFARPSKRSGAWMSNFRPQQKLDGDTSPIIVNVMNFAKGGDGEASLLTFDDARTLFHEFGHGLHGLLSDVTYPMISGTSVARDFVELPSQLFEHWLSEPQVLKKFAIHYKSGNPMPDELLKRLLAAENFNQGFSTVEYISSALVDMELHQLPTPGDLNVTEFERKTLAEIGMPKQITMRHRIPHFAHVFSGDGYSAGYYSYMWSEVMDADAFRAFEETGNVFDAQTAEKLKNHIYSAGGRQDPGEAYKAFRGKLPGIEALLEKRGLS